MRWLLPLAALVAATLVLVSPGGADVTDPVVAVDTEPTGNTATFVNTIDPCREVTVGPPGFDIDVTIEQVTDLAGFEAKLHYNPAVLKVTDVNYKYFLREAGEVTDWGEATPDSDGTFSMVATLFPLPPTGASGEGVLARLTLEAVANGGSVLDLSHVKLADINNNPIQPADSQGIYLGPVNDATISVGGPCSTPTPTPTPTPDPPHPPVGGIAQYPNADDSLLGTTDSSGGSSSPPYAALATGLVVAVLALTAGAWYSRRRLLS